MTVVIDCNIFVICLTSRSEYHAIYQYLVKGKFNLAISFDILLEYEEILQQKYGIATAQVFTTLLSELPNIKFVYPRYNWRLIEADNDDNKYADCAIAGQATYIVTEDRHFDVLKQIPFPALKAINIDSFMEILQML